MAKAIPLKIIAFLKKKQEELPYLIQFFQTPPAEDHGLHGYINPEILKKGAFKLSFHTFCCYTLLKPHLALLDVAYLIPSAEQETWSTRVAVTDIGIALLEEQAPWLTTEISLVVKEIIQWNLLLNPTCAPEQLITQWYVEQLFGGLELLRDAGTKPSTEDMEAVRYVFEEGENLLAKQAALKA